MRRVARTFRGLHPAFARPDDDWARARLVEPERSLYEGMDPRDRDHAVRVARRVLQSDPGAPDVVVRAALLHDLGKSQRRYRVTERILVHVVKRAGLLPTPDKARGSGMFAVAARHAVEGARAIRDAGGDEHVAHLVERHDDPGRDPLAALLHDADAST